MSNNPDIYNLQCFSHGYCGQVKEGHPLFEKCVAREAEGFLDALCVNNDPQNCSECAEEQRKRDHLDLNCYDDRRTKNSDWYDETPLSEEEQVRFEALLARNGIKKVCWECKNYRCSSMVCMDCDEHYS